MANELKRQGRIQRKSRESLKIRKEQRTRKEQGRSFIPVSEYLDAEIFGHWKFAVPLRRGFGGHHFAIGGTREGEGSFGEVVELDGIEPTAFWVQTRRSPI